VPRLVLEVDLTLSGETFRIRTNAGDQLRAERALGANPQEHPMEQVYHVWYAAFRRKYPDHPAAKAFGRFVDDLEATEDVPDEDDLDATDEAGPLAIPTLEAGSDT